MLLEQARSGEIESGVPLAVPSHLGVDLNASQVERLSKAADRAEVQGAGKALVLMDGKGFVIDVVSRTVTGMIDPASAGVVDGIDAVVLAGADGEGAPGTTGANRASGSVLTLPRSSLAMQPNIAKLLEQGFGRDEGASAA